MTSFRSLAIYTNILKALRIPVVEKLVRFCLASHMFDSKIYYYK